MDEFLESLRMSDRRAYVRYREGYEKALQDHGPFMGEPVFKSLGDQLFEIRWHVKNRGHARLYCSQESGRRIVVYAGEVKRSEKFAHRNVCLRRRADYQGQGYDEECREHRQHGAEFREQQSRTIRRQGQ